METINTSKRLASLRDLMKKHKLDIYSANVELRPKCAVRD